MYRILDLISERGTSGLGMTVQYMVSQLVLTSIKLIRLSSLKTLSSISWMKFLPALTCPWQRSTSRLSTGSKSSPLGFMGVKTKLFVFWSPWLLLTTLCMSLHGSWFIYCHWCLDSATKLNNSPEMRTEKPALRSGLYICRVSESVSAAPERMYVIYWPEESTWDDDASPPVRRNRVTFMRWSHLGI